MKVCLVLNLHDIAYKLLFMFLVKDKGSTMTKSMLASKNLPKAITKPSEGRHWIRVLAAELALRLNDARRLSPNLWPKSIVLHARRGTKLRTSFNAML
jgi:DNA polymerase eta